MPGVHRILYMLHLALYMTVATIVLRASEPRVSGAEQEESSLEFELTLTTFLSIAIAVHLRYSCPTHDPPTESFHPRAKTAVHRHAERESRLLRAA